MRRSTLMLLVFVFLLLAVAAFYQIRLATRPGRFPGPTRSPITTTSPGI